MIKISKQNNSLIVEGIDNVFYPNNGDNSYPLNSLIVVTDNSDMATFRSVATNDVLFSGLIQNITINGEAVTKDNIIQKFDAVSNSSTGGGGGTVDAYTKEEADNKFATKTELTNVQTVANDADTKVDALTTRVEGVETSMNGKQDLLVSGTNIKTINNQSILGEGNIEISDYYTKTEADEIFATTTEVRHQAADISALQTDMRGKQATLVSGENIKTINSESILGNGDIQISGVSEEQAQEIAKIPTLETDMMGKQDTLVSGTNIKTINGESVLGEGNIEVAKKTDIPSTDNLATKDELTAVETVANNADAKADAATSKVEGVETALGNKQDTLVSGTNIKTINSQSILGSGDLAISGVSEEQAQEIAKIPTIEAELAKKANVSDVPKVQTNERGTNKNYVYSNAYTSTHNDKVLSNCSFFKGTTDKLEMSFVYWGDYSYQLKVPIPLATSSTAGIMSGNDKIKLDSIPENIPTQTEVDNIASNVSALQTAMDGKQPTLVSGTNIKTVNSQSILGEGNIEISGGAKIYEASEIPNTLREALYQSVAYSKNNFEYVSTIDLNTHTDVIDFLNNLKISDYLHLNNETLIQYYGVSTNYYKFSIKTDNEIVGCNVYGKLISLNILDNTLYISNNNSGYVLQKNDLKTINGEEIVGSGNIEISGGVSDEQAQEIAKIPTLETSLNNKQDTLVSGTNIKTVNSQSILGEGNIEVTIPDATTATSGAMSAADKTKLDSISTEWTGTQSEFDALTTKDDNIIYYVTE